jgi:hypothetical protein
MSRKKTVVSTAPRTLGDLIVAVEDEAAKRTRGQRNRRRLSALWVTLSLLGTGNTNALRRLATAG